MKQKILYIVQSAGYGVTRYLDLLLKNINNTCYEQVLVASDYYNQTKYKNLVDRLIIIPMQRDVSLKEDIGVILTVRKIIKEENPHIVYGHSAKGGIYSRLSTIGTNIKVIYNPHGWSFNMKVSFSKRFFYKTVECILSLFTDKIINISNSEKESVKHFISSKKLITIYNGIDLSISSEDLVNRQELNISSSDFVVGLCARISYQKAQDVFIKSARIIKNKIPNAKFVLVGGKSDDIPIEEMIDNLGLEGDVIITGEVCNAEQYNNIFDIAVLCSRWEGFGLVLAEYMKYSKPIVATNVDAIPELIENEKNGLLVDVNDENKLADAILRLYFDKKLAMCLASEGNKVVNERFDIRRVVEEHYLLFDSLV